MNVMNPCDCGGLPYVSPYVDQRSYYNDMYVVRCMLCGDVGMLEYTEDDALSEWNTKMKKYIAE